MDGAHQLGVIDQGCATGMPNSQSERRESRPFSYPVRVQLLSSWDELGRYRSEWEGLLLASDSSSIFSTPEWLQAYWHAYGNGRETKCLLFAGHDGELVGLAGLCSDGVKTWLGKTLRRLSFVGDGTFESALLDLIVRRGFEKFCAPAFVDWLSSQREWDICELNTFAPYSANLRELLSYLSSCKWTHRVLTTPSSAITLPDSWEKYLPKIPRKERSKIRHRTKKLEDRFRVTFTKCTTEAQLPGALDALFELHQKRWNQRGLPGAFSRAGRRGFYQEMALSFLKRGWLELWQMRLDDRLVASQFGFRYKDTVHMLQKGFDPDCEDLSVGYVLEARVIKILISEGVRCYDYLRGAETSKQLMGAERSYYVNLQFARPFSIGALFLRMDQMRLEAKAWLRENLPVELLKRVKRIYYGLLGQKTDATSSTITQVETVEEDCE